MLSIEIMSAGGAAVGINAPTNLGRSLVRRVEPPPAQSFLNNDNSGLSVPLKIRYGRNAPVKQRVVVGTDERNLLRNTKAAPKHVQVGWEE